MITRNNKSEQYFELFSKVEFILRLIGDLRLDWMYIMPAATMKNELDALDSAAIDATKAIADFVQSNAGKFAVREGKEVIDYLFDSFDTAKPSKELQAKRYDIGLEYAIRVFREYTDSTLNECANKEASEDEER